MHLTRGFRIIACAGTTALTMGFLASGPAAAAPGDWVNVSAIPSGSSYPEISTSAVASVEIFGEDVQVAWSRTDSASSRGIYTAILNKDGSIKTGSTPVITGLTTVSNYPQLVAFQGQRAISFGAESRGQSVTTSPNGTAWSLNPGSLSATNLASTSSGGGTVNSAGDTLIWAGAPNLGSFTWHVGLASTNPAPPGTDQVYSPPVSGTSGVNVVYEASTNTTYGAYYLRDSRAANAGTFIAQLHPTYSGFTQVPGSFIVDDAGNAQSAAAGSVVPLAARAQGGVYVAYLDSNYRGSLKVREMATGRVLDIPQSQDAENASLSAGSNGRLWLSFEKSGQVYTAQTDPGAKEFSRPVAWGTPEKGASIYDSVIKGDSSNAYVVANAYAGRAQNMWATSVIPNLTVEVVGKARAGASVKLRVRDGGAGVRNARVTVDGRKYKSGPGGVLTVKTPRAASVKVVAKGSGYRDGVATIALKR